MSKIRYILSVPFIIIGAIFLFIAGLIAGEQNDYPLASLIYK